MESLSLVDPKTEYEHPFLSGVRKSKILHSPWVNPPATSSAYQDYLYHAQQDNQKSYFLMNHTQNIVGVFNINEIVRGIFQSAYLGFYAMSEFAGKGYMSIGLKRVLNKIFEELELHRIEVNVQPENSRSINLVKQNGFREEGYSPRYLKIGGEWRDHLRFAMTLEDWVSLNKSHFVV